MTHCLVVDDSAVVRKVARRIFEDFAFTVGEAENGQQALVACREKMPDAVLLDWSMPVMDGYEFLKALRKMDGGDKPKVIFCMTEYDVGQIARAMRAGANDHIMKPFDRTVLEGKFQEMGLL